MSINIIDKAHDFTRFVEALSNKMMGAVALYPNDVCHLCVEEPIMNGERVFEFPVTLNDYLEIWNQVTENLKKLPDTYVAITNTDEHRLQCLFAYWDYDKEEYGFE